MSIHELSDNTVRDLAEAFALDLNEQQLAKASAVIERMLVQTIQTTSKACQEAAASCYAPESEVSSKVSEEIERAESALIANLSSLR